MAFSPENIARVRESFLDRRHLAAEESEKRKQQLQTVGGLFDQSISKKERKE